MIPSIQISDSPKLESNEHKRLIRHYSTKSKNAGEKWHCFPEIKSFFTVGQGTDILWEKCLIRTNSQESN